MRRIPPRFVRPFLRRIRSPDEHWRRTFGRWFRRRFACRIAVAGGVGFVRPFVRRIRWSDERWRRTFGRGFARGIAVRIVAVGVVVAAHSRIRSTAQAAPKPLSMPTTVRPAAHEASIPSRAVMPPRLAP